MQQNQPTGPFPFIGKVTEWPTTNGVKGRISIVFSINNEGESEISEDPKEVWDLTFQRLTRTTSKHDAKAQFFIFTKSGTTVGSLYPFKSRQERCLGTITGQCNKGKTSNFKIISQSNGLVVRVAPEIWSHYLKTYSDSAGQPGTPVSFVLVDGTAVLLKCENVSGSSQPQSRSEPSRKSPVVSQHTLTRSTHSSETHVSPGVSPVTISQDSRPDEATSDGFSGEWYTSQWYSSRWLRQLLSGERLRNPQFHKPGWSVYLQAELLQHQGWDQQWFNILIRPKIEKAKTLEQIREHVAPAQARLKDMHIKQRQELQKLIDASLPSSNIITQLPSSKILTQMPSSKISTQRSDGNAGAAAVMASSGQRTETSLHSQEQPRSSDGIWFSKEKVYYGHPVIFINPVDGPFRTVFVSGELKKVTSEQSRDNFHAAEGKKVMAEIIIDRCSLATTPSLARHVLQLTRDATNTFIQSGAQYNATVYAQVTRYMGRGLNGGFSVLPWKEPDESLLTP